MGMDYHSLEQFEMDFPYFNSGSQPEKFKIFLIGESLEARTRGVTFMKEFLEEQMLKPAQDTGEINDYEVEIVNLQQVKDILNHVSWERARNKSGNIYIPLFHNADAASHLPQMAFDSNRPGIFSLTKKGYDAVINPSKRRCYDTLKFE